MKSLLRWFIAISFGVSLIALIGYLLVVYGVIRMNYPSKIIYPVQGIDVSHHQGEIDFEQVKMDGWDFVIMKSTEGGDWKDTRFNSYYKDARKAGLTVGVYHYYSFCTDPIVQVNHFIDVVGDLKGDLPPAIDLEFDNNCNTSIPVQKFRANFKLFLDRLLEHYNVYPIIYCNEAFYEKYLNVKDFEKCLFWVRNIISQPDLAGRMWDFWQYTAKGSVPGINGAVDLNAFSGRRFQFEELILN
ncbi:glycoside hydrolase family 25 protein [Parvicella tangerina]|uniref:Lysozyme M1 n=1 Tax=Parvicella tangerina TaxID=2829795 RepID=A0A916NI92_9FLAO|nr:GH25 family lysozyme [Parvicella tangerina]CAG5083480.1 Lysozyme M1 [Parvicella tangerina]